MGGVMSLLEMPGGLVSFDRPVWEVALMFAVLPLWGGIVGNLPLRWFGGVASGSAGAGPQRRRIVHMAGWYIILAITALPKVIALRTGMMAGMLEAVMAGFLVNFWLSDALSQHSFPARFSRKGVRPGLGGSSSPDTLERQPPQKGGFSQTLRLSLPMLVLVLAGFGWSAAMQMGRFSGFVAWSGGWVPQAVVSVATMATLSMVAVPLLVRYCWGLKPLRGPETNALIHEELDANGVSVAKICSWPDGMMGFATAGIIGLIPPFRYLLISPALAAMLTPSELRSVIAHEAGHIKHRHLWYFLAAIIGFILLMQAAILLLDWSSLWAGFQMPGWLQLVGYFGGLLLFLRFGIGLVSRIFERQADGNALRRLGPDAFSQAITKLAAYNRIPMEDDNWHHYGIAQRIRHARDAGAGGERLDRHDRRASRLKVGLVALLVMGVLAEVTLSSGAVTAYLDRMVLENGEALTQAHLPNLNRLAYRAVSREEHEEAQRYYRIILGLAPDNPTAQNNLAWMLVTRPGASEPEMKEGLHLAETAAAQWEHAYIWDTLAETYFRLERYDQALRTAQKALYFAEAGKSGGGASLGYYQEQVRKFSRFGGKQIEPGSGGQ
ncbi:MAG: M48 family metalloprotease [bacterium]